MKMKPEMLVILDGFGYSPKKKFNAIYKAHSIIMKWAQKYPSCLIKASGKSVGLLDRMIGNSEVGHLTIGAGRIIPQPSLLLHEEIVKGSFFKDQKLLKLLKKLKQTGGALHLIGLLSDAGVHSHEEVLFALIKLASIIGIKKVYIHPILDGRDVLPQSATLYLNRLQRVIKKFKLGEIGSIQGRFYAMDRDKHWDRTQLSYNILTQSHNPQFTNWKSALKYFYQQGITDEFIPPTSLNKNAYFKDGDGIIFFNIREDRARQLTQAFVDKKFDKFPIKKIKFSWIITGISYSPDFKVNYVLTKKKKVNDTLFDILEKEKLSIFSIAETEKYAHITYFFNGGREIIRPDETRILIPSKSSEFTYANIPKMSAPQITESVIYSLKHDPKDFYLINFANADMVGHSGNLEATIHAIKCLDEQLKKIFNIIINQLNGTLYITADHGNAEDKFDLKSKQPKTAHTINPVPFIMIKKNLKHYHLPVHELSDIAPFILENLGIDIPKEMKK